MTPYRTPAPPPVELARRLGWLERIWTRARRRLVVWWRLAPFMPGRRGALGAAMDREEKKREARRLQAFDDAGAHLVRNAEYNRQIRDFERAQKRPPPPPEPFRDPRPVDE